MVTVYSFEGVPRQAEVAQGVPGRLKASDLLDFRHYKGCSSSAKRTSRLYPRRNPWYSFSEAESTSGHMVLSEGTTKKIPSDTTGIDPGTVRLVAQRLNHYATPGPVYSFTVSQTQRDDYRKHNQLLIIHRKQSTGLSD